jgi:Tfp pilus assembly protein PilF
MRDFKNVMRAFLGAAALTSFVGCEEVDPPKPQKPVVSSTVSVTPPTPPPVESKTVEPPVPTKVAVVDDKGGDKSDDPIAGARDALSTGELDRALKLAKMAVQKTPTRSSSWNTLGRAQLKLGQRKSAIESFEKAVELNPRSSWAQNNLGLALIYDGQFEDAVDALEEATKLPHVEGYMWNNLGMAYEHLDRLDDARKAYQSAVATKASNAEQNLARLAGVRTIRTAKNESVRGDVVVVPGAVDLGSDVDGGSH